MFRKALITTTAALMIASPALATTPVHQIEVETDLSAIANPEALAYWGGIAPDLQEAIAARLAADGQLAPEGATVSVDIDELALANTFQTLTSDEEAVLVGQVNVTSETDNSDFDSYIVTVNTSAAHAFDKDGKLKKGAYFDSPAYYVAMVNAFANQVVARLE
ncbi:hypothetical protein SAMN05877809_107167 [Rhodobacter sp. JA431]|uniref:hypothetical protein n=1 Tax=Rhodobacter sp. JA431 TaxID=570013 RepID=UPI000BDB836A|nr:hypothetical protein [Rhodobacter sp. JA431]SOC14517.1 hypothetical protein SAMN05877809_107167 [Rhodobacter sp. JA431]